MQIDLLSRSTKYLRDIIAKLQITGNKGPIWRKRSRRNLTRPNFLPPLNVVYGAISAYFSHFLPTLRRSKAKSRVLWRKYFSECAYDCKCSRHYIITKAIYLLRACVCVYQRLLQKYHICSEPRAQFTGFHYLSKDLQFFRK